MSNHIYEKTQILKSSEEQGKNNAENKKRFLYLGGSTTAIGAVGSLFTTGLTFPVASAFCALGMFAGSLVFKLKEQNCKNTFEKTLQEIKQIREAAVLHNMNKDGVVLPQLKRLK